MNLSGICFSADKFPLCDQQVEVILFDFACRFRDRHPDLRSGNVLVRSRDFRKLINRKQRSDRLNRCRVEESTVLANYVHRHLYKPAFDGTLKR